ncbi:MAG: hypothetical protein AAFS12_02565 [Cyanobacteria bacterium J06632_19]
MKDWELGMGNWALGIGHWTLPIFPSFPEVPNSAKLSLGLVHLFDYLPKWQWK